MRTFRVDARAGVHGLSPGLGVLEERRVKRPEGTPPRLDRMDAAPGAFPEKQAGPVRPGPNGETPVALLAGAGTKRGRRHAQERSDTDALVFAHGDSSFTAAALPAHSAYKGPDRDFIGRSLRWILRQGPLTRAIRFMSCHGFQAGSPGSSPRAASRGGLLPFCDTPGARAPGRRETDPGSRPRRPGSMP